MEGVLYLRESSYPDICLILGGNMKLSVSSTIVAASLALGGCATRPPTHAENMAADAAVMGYINQVSAQSAAQTNQRTQNTLNNVGSTPPPVPSSYGQQGVDWWYCRDATDRIIVCRR